MKDAVQRVVGGCGQSWWNSRVGGEIADYSALCHGMCVSFSLTKSLHSHAEDCLAVSFFCQRQEKVQVAIRLHEFEVEPQPALQHVGGGVWLLAERRSSAIFLSAPPTSGRSHSSRFAKRCNRAMRFARSKLVLPERAQDEICLIESCQGRLQGWNG